MALLPPRRSQLLALLLLLSPLPRATTAAYSDAFEVTSADSMSMVTRDWLPQRQCASGATDGGRFGRGLSIDMAQNEREAAQLVVYVADFMPAAVVGGVSVRLATPLTSETGGATIPAADVSIVPLGFVKGGPCPFDAEDPSCPAERPLRCKLGDATNATTRCVGRGADAIHCVGCSSSQGMINFRPEYRFNNSKDWYPWALLDYLQSFSVRRGTAQPVLITVRTRADTPPGVYNATVGVSSAEHGHSSTSLTVHVHAVALPTATSSLSLWCAQSTESEPAFAHRVQHRGASGGGPGPGGGGGGSLVNLSAFSELLLSQRLPAATCIYSGVWPAYLNQSQPAGQQPLGVPAAQAVRQLWERGQRLLVIANFDKCHAMLNATGCECVPLSLYAPLCQDVCKARFAQHS